MKKMYQILFLMIVATFCVLSCSKEDENSSINQNGGEVFRSQVVIIDLPGVDLDQNEYQALFGGQNITVSKSDEHKLFFLVPYSTTLGKHDLVISSLNDATIHYDVQDTMLSETVEVTMESFFANLQTFSQNLDSSPEAVDAQNSIDSFNNYYSNASLEDKTEIAILYKANKIMFDKVLQNIDITSRAIDSNALCLGKAVIGMGASIPLLLAPTGATQIAGVVLFGTSAYYAKKCGKPLWNEFVLAEFININGILGTNQRNTFVAFTNDVNSTLPLNTVNRKLISSDASRTESTWVYFFPYFNLLNANIAKVNTAIQEVNDLPFVNFPLIPQIQLPASSPEVNTVVNQTIFSNIQFSVNHPNLQLVSSSLESDGQLNMKIKIIGTPTSLPVESFLNYTYSDEFSSFSGKLPIKIDVLPNFYVGMDYQGGKIVYIFAEGDPHYVIGEVHGLIAAPYDQSAGTIWGCSTFDIMSTTMGLPTFTMGDGLQNTIDILGECTSAANAAQICSSLTLGGYDDWYLPNKNELNEMAWNKNAIGGFANTYYWSSSWDNNDMAWEQDFGDSSNHFQRRDLRSSTSAVRAVRLF